jgi:hypothetical protein
VTRQLATSPDGQWAVLRDGRELSVYAAGAGPELGHATLDTDDADIAIVNGPPNLVIVAARDAVGTVVTLHAPPELAVSARLELGAPARIATLAGGRLAMVSTDNREMTIVRAAGTGLASHPVDLQGGIVEFVVGIERNQLVMGQLRKLEVWDAVSGRPLRKLALELPPPPRTVGAAAGHIWVTRPGSDEVFVYRLSDARPFRHYLGAPVEDVIAHPMSPLVVLVTPRGLVRLHCYAHSLFAVESPWQHRAPIALAQLVAGNDISLLGWPAGAAEAWRVVIGGLGAPMVIEGEAEPEPELVTAADKLRAMRGAVEETAARNAATIDITYGGKPNTPPPFQSLKPLPPAPPPDVTSRAATVDISRDVQRALVEAARTGDAKPHPAPPRGTAWREQLAHYGGELVRGVDPELPASGNGSDATELGELAHRLALAPAARRALAALYGLYLVGEPAPSIARLARALGEWSEALGQGQLAAFAMLDRSGGHVALHAAVTSVLDGAAPHDVRIVEQPRGGAATTPRAGVFRIAREARTDAAIESELAAQLGRIAVIETSRFAHAVLEARMRGATAVATTVPAELPRPWPLGAGLVLVLYSTATAWVADVPALQP